VQYRAGVLAAAARCDHHGWSALSAGSHREATRRKNDPYGVLMYRFRSDVRMVMRAGPAACVHYVATGKLTTTPATDTTQETGAHTMADWTEAQLRAMMQAEEEEYAIRFWVSPGGTGTALRNMISKMNLQLDRIEADTDAFQAAGRTLGADGLTAESRELVTALDASVNELAAAPLAAHLSTLLNTDGTMDPVEHGERGPGE
jgi:hypothetical protein